MRPEFHRLGDGRSGGVICRGTVFHWALGPYAKSHTISINNCEPGPFGS